jgi:hypothetical protein
MQQGYYSRSRLAKMKARDRRRGLGLQKEKPGEPPLLKIFWRCLRVYGNL